MKGWLVVSRNTNAAPTTTVRVRKKIDFLEFMFALL
jgi:hypothetical protein